MTRRNPTLLQALGFVPARPTKTELLKSRREFKVAVRKRVKADRAEWSRLKKSARSGRTASTRKLEQLFHEVYGRDPNPREIAGILGGKRMAGKKRRTKKKKRNPRKGVMPPGLRKYWAKKRAKKNPRRRKKAKRNPRPRVRVRTRTVIKYRTRRVKVYPKRRRRKSNPRRSRRTIRIQAPAGLGPKGLRKFRAMAAKAYGAPARIVKR